MLKLHINDFAKSDLAEVFEYYSNISPELPKAFLDEFETALSLLCEAPGIGSRRFSHLFPLRINLRTWRLDRFPFRIFYRVDDDTLYVLRVDHQRRDVTKATLGPRGRVKTSPSRLD